MLDIVIELEVAFGFKTHQSHADLVKLLYCFDLLLSYVHLLVADRVVCTDLLFIEHLTCFFANKPLRRSQLLVVHSIYFCRSRLLGRYYTAVER